MKKLPDYAKWVFRLQAKKNHLLIVVKSFCNFIFDLFFISLEYNMTMIILPVVINMLHHKVFSHDQKTWCKKKHSSSFMLCFENLWYVETIDHVKY